jgi:hypothetical protein
MLLEKRARAVVLAHDPLGVDPARAFEVVLQPLLALQNVLARMHIGCVSALDLIDQAFREFAKLGERLLLDPDPEQHEQRMVLQELGKFRPHVRRATGELRLVRVVGVNDGDGLTVANRPRASCSTTATTR